VGGPGGQRRQPGDECQIKQLGNRNPTPDPRTGSGLWIDDIRLGSPEPLAAVHDATNFESFSEVIVCTLPSRMSRWLKLCLPHRVERTTGLPVNHVVADRRRATRFVREHVAERELIAA